MNFLSIKDLQLIAEHDLNTVDGPSFAPALCGHTGGVILPNSGNNGKLYSFILVAWTGFEMTL